MNEQQHIEQLRQEKDQAYEERNRVVALLAAMAAARGWRVGIAKTAIEGWSEDWHGCVWIDLPNGQASWHFHDSHAWMFQSFQPYFGTWDGHTTAQKYDRVAELVGKLTEEGAPRP